MSYKECFKEIKATLVECKDMEERIHRMQKILPPLLRLCLYLNVGVAVNHVANGQYVLAGFNLLVGVFCLEVNLYCYRQREKRVNEEANRALQFREETFALLDEIYYQLDAAQEINEEIKGNH